LRIKSIFEISEKKNSLGNRFREKRFNFFLNKFDKLSKPLSILDLGGKINFWENRGITGNTDYQITILNTEKEESNYSNINCQIGDATNLSQFNNKSFDVVHSNSCIEHLYIFENQKKMASEVIRVGKKYVIQTPNKYFFIEPHYLLPFFQFFPNSLKFNILTKTRISRLKMWDEKFAKQYIDEIRLMTLNELKILFPNSNIFYEKFFGMNKSFTVHNFKL
jgi:predicted SAM-dependent methyltransferase